MSKVKFLHLYIYIYRERERERERGREREERERVVAGPKSRCKTPVIRFSFTVNIARIAGRT